jgi:hypothetical protein
MKNHLVGLIVLIFSVNKHAPAGFLVESIEQYRRDTDIRAGDHVQKPGGEEWVTVAVTVVHPVLFNAFKRLASGASASEKADLFAGTASRFYRLGVESTIP